jgi:mono/diheme cytochrome c family protein
MRRLFMEILRLAVVVAAAEVLFSLSGFAAENGAGTGDPDYGLILARRWCASCHIISADQQRSRAGAPPFAVIARSPNFNADHLAYVLLAPHPSMARLDLSRTAIDDIAAYIESLKK